jgi:glycosyltransferase involved in cell wall biosynthesis
MKADRPIRVLQVIDDLGGGGAQRLLWDLVRLSDPRRVKHHVETVLPYAPVFLLAAPMKAHGAYDFPSPPPGDAPPARPPRRVTAATFYRSARRLMTPPLRRLPESWKRPFRSAEVILPALPRMLRRVAELQPDVIHGHNLLGFRASLLLHALTGIPWVVTVSCNFAQLEHYGWGELVSEYRYFRQRIARWFIAAEYVDQLRGIGVPASRIEPLRGVVDLAAAEAAGAQAVHHRRAVRRELGISDDALLVLSVGRLDPTKGHEYAVAALPSLVGAFPDLHWVLLGQGSARHAEQARALGVGGHAHVLGYRDDPLPYYAAADLYLRTTLLEADTMSSYNAMALGIPVVGFRNQGATELVPRVGHGLLVSCGDPAALADGVRQVLSLPDRGRAMGARGRAYAAQHLDIGDSVAELVRSYAQVAASRAHARSARAG